MSEKNKKKALDTQIRISKETREILEKLGAKGETYDDIIRRLISLATGGPFVKEAGKAK